jgi:hypothetical protein
MTIHNSWYAAVWDKFNLWDLRPCVNYPHIVKICWLPPVGFTHLITGVFRYKILVLSMLVCSFFVLFACRDCNRCCRGLAGLVIHKYTVLLIARDQDSVHCCITLCNLTANFIMKKMVATIHAVVCGNKTEWFRAWKVPSTEQRPL